MTKRSALVAALVGVVGCSSGSDDAPSRPSVVVDLRTDANRDGWVDLVDPADDENEDAWSAMAGAIFLPNLDDDALACPRGGQVVALSDTQLAECRDSANEVVDGPEDEADLARLIVKPWPGAPDNASGRVWLAPAAANHVRLFRKQGGSWQVLPFVDLGEGAGMTWLLAITADEIRAGVELGLEGRDFVRSTTGWDGLAEVHLGVDTVSSGVVSDVVQLRVAPLLLSHHLQPTEQLYATRTAWAGNMAFRADLDPAAVAAAVAVVDNGQFDHWTQDWMEIGYATAPAPNGEQRRLDVFMRSTNVYRPGEAGNELREAGREVYQSYHGMNSAGYTPPYDLGQPQEMDTLNSYGNTETIPPHSHDGKSYALGRVLRGSSPSFYPSPAMDDFLAAQRLQPTVFIDTSWLDVAHVDETLSFVKTSSPLGFGVVINDATLAKQMLEELASQGHGDAAMFVGKSWYNVDTDGITPAEATVAQVLADTDVMAESKRAQVEVDAQLDVLKAAVGIQDSDLIPAPFLHWPSYGRSIAYQPGTVNGQVLSNKHFAVPTPHGPRIDGQDPFESQLVEAFGKHGITVHFVEDWDMLHRLSGEVHCGTNAKRAPLSDVFWWEASP